MKQQTIVIPFLRRVLLTGSGLSASFVWALTDSTVNWNVDSGNAAMSANYNPATAPGVSTLVRIGNGGEMQIDSDLTWGALWVGYNGSGVVRQSAGTLSVSNPTQNSQDGVFTLGYNPSNVGRYHLSGGSVVCTVGKPTIGWSGFGLLDISGGAFSATNFRSLGLFSDGSGHVDVHGNGTFDTSSTPQIIVGENGQGVITVRDGGEASIEKILVASGATSTGMVNVASGGTFSASAIEGGSGALKKLNVAGGTVKAQGAADAVTNYLSGVTVSVGAGGLVFDTNGKTVVIQSPITSSRLVADNLAHRWSFNGNATDSVSGTDAVAMGVTYENGEVVLPGTESKNWRSHVHLGGGCIPSGKDGITIEMWTTPVQLKAWARMFTCASASPSNFDSAQSSMWFTWMRSDVPSQDTLSLKIAGTVKPGSETRGILTPWDVGVKRHVTFVFEKQDSDWRIDICKREIDTGKVLRRYSTTAPLSWDPAELTSAFFGLGYSQYESDVSAAVRFDEIRIWQIALTEDELLESTTRGPDADMESASGLRKVGAGALTLTSAANYANGTRVEAGTLALRASERPIHRWSFENGSLADSVGGRTAELFGSVVGAADGKGLDCLGGPHAQSCIGLGKNVIPTNGAGYTIELWGALHSPSNNSRLFSVTAGQNGYNMIYMSWCRDSDNNSDWLGYKYNGADVSELGRMAPYVTEQPYHVAVVVAPTGGDLWSLAFYKQNATTDVMEKTCTLSLPDGWTPASLADANFMLSFSPYSSDYDANARYDEVRIWNRPFSAAEVEESGRIGPDDLPRFANVAEGAGALPTATTLTIDSGATFWLGDTSQTVAKLVGTGAIDGPGTLTVTDSICPGGSSSIGTFTIKRGVTLVGTVELDICADGSCDRIDFDSGATYDITGIHWTISNLAPAASCDSFTIANATGAALTGEFDISGIPVDYAIRRKRDGNVVFKRIKGTTLVVR